MRIRLSLTLDLDRATKPEPETREFTGALVEMAPQPRMIGFQPEGES